MKDEPPKKGRPSKPAARRHVGLSVSLPPEEIEFVREQKNKTGMSMSEVIAECVRLDRSRRHRAKC
jgi:Arc/MetJ-type ribon-helix-helix transcriptional regulator